MWRYGKKLFIDIFGNSFAGLEKDISSFDCGFDTVYMFGIDKNLVDKIRIDLCACYNSEHICTDFDLLPLERKLNESNISYYISKKPTRYLCNAAYYHMLKKNPNTIFIHIPSLKRMNNALMSKLTELFWVHLFGTSTQRSKSNDLDLWVYHRTQSNDAVLRANDVKNCWFVFFRGLSDD